MAWGKLLVGLKCRSSKIQQGTDRGESCQAFSKCVSPTHTGDQPPVVTHGITTTVPAEEAPEMRDCSEFSYMDMRLVEFG